MVALVGQREAALQVCPAPLAPGRGTTKVFIHHRPATGYMAARRNTLCAHNPAVLFIRQKIKVAQRIVTVTVALASGLVVPMARR